MDEDTILRQLHPLYDAFCREDEDDVWHDTLPSTHDGFTRD